MSKLLLKSDQSLELPTEGNPVLTEHVELCSICGMVMINV